MQLPNLIGPITGTISGDEYMKVLVARQEAYVATRPTPTVGLRIPLPPLYEWFIQPGDENHVILPK